MHTMIAWLPRTRKLSKFIEVSSQQSLSRPPEDIKKPPMFPGVLKGNIGQKPFNATVSSTTVIKQCRSNIFPRHSNSAKKLDSVFLPVETLYENWGRIVYRFLVGPPKHSLES